MHVRSSLLAVAVLVACDSSPTTPKAHAVSIGAPPEWFGAVDNAGYEVGLTDTRRSGGAAGYLTGLTAGNSGIAAIGQSVTRGRYSGTRVRWSCWVKHESLEGKKAGLFMRVDRADGIAGLDEMEDRKLTGTSDWHQVSIVLDVGTGVVGFTVGAMLVGRGLLLVDDCTIEIVGPEVPVTSTIAGPRILGYAGANLYPGMPDFPLNLGLEPALPESATTTWLADHSASLETTDPTASLADLAVLNPLIGSARVVGLGQATNGTHEYYAFKARMVKHLVSQMGFTRFAIEATAPESDDINRYVLGGPGNAASLLSRLYEWHLRTQEFLDLIEWMRSYNTTVSSAKQVQFIGLDPRYPAASLDSVNAFMMRVDPQWAPYIADRLSCIGPYRNNGPSLAAAAEYTKQSFAVRTACAQALAAAGDFIESMRPAYSAAEPSRYESVLHAARLISQFETNLPATRALDELLAANVRWIDEQSPAGTKIILWTHDTRVNQTYAKLGDYMNGAFANGYLAVGFVFGTGSFNAADTETNEVHSWSNSGQATESIARLFESVNRPLIVFDARQLADTSAVTRPLTHDARVRSIGSTFNPLGSNYRSVTLPADFDLLVFIAKTTPTTLLPYTP